MTHLQHAARRWRILDRGGFRSADRQYSWNVPKSKRPRRGMRVRALQRRAHDLEVPDSLPAPAWKHH